MIKKIEYKCGHTYPWVLTGINNNCVYCDGEYPDGSKCSGGKILTTTGENDTGSNKKSIAREKP